FANGRAFQVTSSAVGTTTTTQSYNYNLFRNLTEFTNENGAVETYIHQQNGLLIKQIHPDGSRVVYEWGSSDPLSPYHEEFLMTSSTDETGNKATFGYYRTGVDSQFHRTGELKQSVTNAL